MWRSSQTEDISTTSGKSIKLDRILIKNADKYFVFKGPDHKKTEEWYRAVVSAIKHSEGFNQNYSYLARYPRFWRVHLY